MVKDRTVRLTAAGKARLEEELNVLRTEKLPELAGRVEAANEHGDVSDNSEYEAMKEDLVLAEARLSELEQLLQRAEVIHPPSGGGPIDLGSKVTLRSDDGEEETWTLVGPEEASTVDGTISTESPVGRALVGRAVGDSTTVATPAGQLVFTIVNVA